MSDVKERIKDSLKKLPKADADQIKKVLKTKLKSEEKKQEEAAKAAAQTSIHPRVVNGRTRHEKVNTCANKSKPSAAKLARMETHHNQHPNDGASKKHFAAMVSRAA